MKAKLFSIRNAFIIIGIEISMISVAQTEVLLGQYTFDSGSGVATNVASNIAFDAISSFTGNTSTFNITYDTTIPDHSCLTLWNSSNTLNPKRGFLIPITPASGKTFVITRMDITHKAGDGGSNNAICWIVDNYSTSDATLISNMYFFGGNATTSYYSVKTILDWKTETFNVTNVVNSTSTCVFNSKKYVLFNMSCTGAANSSGAGGKWNIDDVKIYGFESTTTEIQVPQTLQNAINVLNNGIEVNVKTAQLSIHSLTGAFICSQKVSGTKNINLSNGTYVVRLSDDLSNIVRKVIIK